MHYKIINIFNIILFLPVIYLTIFEISLRLIIFLFTFNLDIMMYGFNKNINLELHSIKNREFYISNDYKLLNNKKNIKLNKDREIWIFGGSTSNSGFCDSKNLSWVDFLESELKKKNFSKNGVNSSFSVNVLKNQLESPYKPEIIIWANKVNEVVYVKRNFNNNDYFHSLKKTLKENIVTFYFFEELLIRLFDKINFNIRSERKILSKDDYILSSENYYQNTLEAVNLSKIYNVEKFYIVSIFNKVNLDNKETEFYKFYEEKVDKITRRESIVDYINTKSYLKLEDKQKKLFCDVMHQNYIGKVLTGKIVSDYINDKK
tara:strand:+ start:1434 stop:2387 length:954 start_codon:yes stop_codon:yes gene_type:complete